MTETTTEQLAEIEGQSEQEPQPQAEPEPQPENCGFEGKILREVLESWLPCDTGDTTTSEQLAEIEPQPQLEPVQVREGRWRTRNGMVRGVAAMPTDHEDFAAAYPWWDGVSTWRNDGRWLAGGSTMDLLEYLGPIEPEPEPEKSITPDDVANAALAGVWNQAKAERTIEELRSEVHYVQRLLGESRQRSNELETLVADLRVINAAQEKAVRAAGQENTDLQHRLEVVSAEWAEQVQACKQTQEQLEAVKAELVQVSRDRYQLRIELDAAQQVPQAVSDRFEEGWDAGTARAVETIAEWTEPFRRCGSERLALAVMANLPHIMRTLTGLAEED